MKDISNISREKAEKEVDKFLLDAEMVRVLVLFILMTCPCIRFSLSIRLSTQVNMYINFQTKLEEDPEFKVPTSAGEDEGIFSLQSLLYVYLGYVGAERVAPFLARKFVESQGDSYSGTHIEFLDAWINKVMAASDAVQSTQ